MKEQVEHTSFVSTKTGVRNTLVLRRYHTLSELGQNMLLEVLREIGPLDETLQTILVDGDNTQYLRWYLPLESTDIRIDGENTEIEVYEDLGKKVVGFMSTVPVGESREYTLSYTIPVEAQGGDPIAYRFMYEKEPGGKNVPLRKSMKVDSGTVIAEYSNEQVTNMLQPLILEDTAKDVVVTNRTLLSYLLYTGN